MREIWRPVEGYENYEVSDLGEVRGEKGILKPENCRGGYQRVTLWKNRKPKHFQIHRLVATTFIPNPDNLPQVNHKNENKIDNRVENLEWCTPKYNSTYGTRNQRMIEKQRNDERKSKPILQFSKDGKFIREWPSMAEVERTYGWDTGFISKCCRGKYKSAYNYLWRYK